MWESFKNTTKRQRKELRMTHLFLGLTTRKTRVPLVIQREVQLWAMGT